MLLLPLLLHAAAAAVPDECPLAAQNAVLFAPGSRHGPCQAASVAVSPIMRAANQTACMQSTTGASP